MAVLATSSTRGVVATLYFIVGGVLGDLVYLSLAIFSLGVLFGYVEPLIFYVKIIGGIYLIYLGYKCFRAKTQSVGGNYSGNGLRQFSAGLLVCISNPKVIIFYLSFLPLFVDLGSLNLATGIELMLVIGLTVTTALLLITFMGNQLRKLMSSESSLRWLNRCSGTMLIGVGLVVMQS